MGRDTIAGLAVLAASLALFWATLGLERHPMVPVGPEFYPQIVLGITAAMAVLLILLDQLARRRAAPARAAPPTAPRANYGLVAASFGIFAAYVVALPWLGFRVATALFMVALQVALETPRGARGWAAVVALALIATATIYYTFEHYLHVLLPRGAWTGF